MSNVSFVHKLAFAVLPARLCLALFLVVAGCGHEQTGSEREPEGPVQEQHGPVQEQHGPDSPRPEEPSHQEPALPRDSMVEAMLRIQLAEAYRARYYVLNAGAAAEPPLMDSLYARALATMGISPARYESNYRKILDHDPVQLQALYDSCESMLQRRLIGLR